MHDVECPFRGVKVSCQIQETLSRGVVMCDTIQCCAVRQSTCCSTGRVFNVCYVCHRNRVVLNVRVVQVVVLLNVRAIHVVVVQRNSGGLSRRQFTVEEIQEVPARRVVLQCC